MLVVVFVSLLVAGALAQSPNGAGRRLVIPVEGTIEPGLSEFVLRALRDARQAGERPSFSSKSTASVDGRCGNGEPRCHLRFPVPTAAFVADRAISAGALIALATRRIVMKPGATFGAAQPQPLDEKTLSYVRADFEATAEGRGRDPLIAAAMVDASVVVEGLSGPGQILTLTAASALARGYADFVASSRREALELLGYGAAPVVEAAPTWAEQVVRFLTDPLVAQILLIVGVLGLIAEVTSPGWGVGGTVGLIALALFFGSRFIVGILGVEAILLFLVGLVLILVELFVIPGFGIAGVLGLAGIGASLFFSFPDSRTAFQALAITAVAIVVTVVIFLSGFRGRSGGRLILTQKQEEDTARLQPTIHIWSVPSAVRTKLRPAGRIEIDGEHYDAVSEGQMVAPGTAVAPCW